MAELEEQLNSILGDPEAMGKIMALARSLSGGEAGKPEESGPAGPQSGEPEQEKGEGPDLSGLLRQMDPGMLQMGMRLFQDYQHRDDRSAALLAALRPFLKEDRRARLDRALELVRMVRLVRAVLGAAGGKGERGDV